MFENLKYVKFSSSSDNQQLAFDDSSSIVFYSNLLKLNVTVNSINDCILLLDDHFKQLHTFYVTISSSNYGLSSEENNKKLINLKYFSFTQKLNLLCCNEVLIPLLQRMSNLEELCLNFVNSYGPIIDSGNLKENILNHMRKLNKFTFNIRSINALTELGHLPLDKDIQSTFWNFKNKEIISYIDYFEKSALFNYHIYSYPYRWTCYDNITNNFPGGIFRCVREISLYDEHPFEHVIFSPNCSIISIYRKMTSK
ncbi:unnamed protein product [Rotaria sp. Silwood2]|nr:unnamed protein product [Rotaria sp. Silwood2]